MCGPKKIISKIAIWVFWWRSFTKVSETFTRSPPTKRRSFCQCEPHQCKKRWHPTHCTDFFLRSATPNPDKCPLHSPILVTREAPHDTRCCGDVSAK